MSRPTTPLPVSHPQATSHPPPNGPYLTTPSKPAPDSNFFTPPRSTTFHPKPSHPHIPHHPHRTHHSHHPDKAVPQSAITASSHNPFGDFLTKTTSRLADRDGSNSGGAGGGVGGSHSVPSFPGIGGTRTPPRLDPATGTETAKAKEETQQQQQQQLSLQLQREEQEKQRRKERETAYKWKEVARMKTARMEADEELRTTLEQLSELSTTTTRKLDYTYYSLLSSVAALRAGVESLRGLSVGTRGLGERIARGAEEVKGEGEVAVRGAEELLERRAEMIEGLEGRLTGGRERVRGLGERLDKVRGRVEECAVRDGEGRRRARGFWRVGWGCLVAVVVVGGLLAYWGVALERREGGGGDVEAGKEGFWDMEMRDGTLGAEDLKGGLEGLRGPEVVGVMNGSGEGVGEMRREKEETRKTEKMDGEATLNLFDEL